MGLRDFALGRMENRISTKTCLNIVACSGAGWTMFDYAHPELSIIPKWELLEIFNQLHISSKITLHEEFEGSENTRSIATC